MGASSKLTPQLLRGVECVYATITLFALTQGPIYRLWSESAAYQQFIALPAVGQAHFSTFLMLQLPALVIWCRTVSITQFREQRFVWLAGLLGWLALTVVWSTFARHSISEYVALVFTTGFGLYLCHRLTTREFWSVIIAAMSIGLLWSLYSVTMLWDGAVDLQADYWIGIYFNRNSLAPVAAVSLVGLIGLLSATRLRQQWSAYVLVGGCLGLTTLAAIVLWKADSQTSPLALAVGVAGLILWRLFRWFATALRLSSRIQRLTMPLAVLIMTAAVFVTLYYAENVTSLSRETTTFNIRRPLWNMSWSGFLLKPIHGWGWMAAWRTLHFFHQGEWWTIYPTEWSHSGYFDLLLGGGIPALVLFMGLVLVGATRIGSLAVGEAAPRLLLSGFVLAAATQESFFIGSHFLWALLIAALFAPDESVPRRFESARRETSGEATARN